MVKKKGSETTSVPKKAKNTPQRALLVKKVPIDNDKVVTYMNGKIPLFTTNPYSIVWVPALQTFVQQVGTFSTAQAKVKQRTIGLAADRDIAKVPMIVTHDCYCSLIQYTADQSPSQSVLIIESYGYVAKNVSTRFKKDVEARHGEVSGTVDLIAKKVGRGAYYEWEQSTDGHTWTRCKGTAIGSNYCEATAKDLTPGTLYFFHLITTLGEVRSNPSDAVAIICI